MDNVSFSVNDSHTVDCNTSCFDSTPWRLSEIALPDYFIFALHGLLALVATSLNGLIIWVLKLEPSWSNFDVIQINMAAYDFLNGFFGSFLHVSARIVLTHDIIIGAKLLALCLCFILTDVTFEDLVTIHTTILRTRQVNNVFFNV